jgi:hypothetical protein
LDQGRCEPEWEQAWEPVKNQWALVQVHPPIAKLILDLNRNLQANTQTDTLQIFCRTRCPQERSKFCLASFLAGSGRNDRVGFPQTGRSGRNGFTLAAILETV